MNKELTPYQFKLAYVEAVNEQISEKNRDVCIRAIDEYYRNEKRKKA